MKPLRLLDLLISSALLIWALPASADSAAVLSEVSPAHSGSDALYVTRPTNADARSTSYVWERVSAAYHSLNLVILPVDVPLARMYLLADQGGADGALAGVAEQIEPRYTNLLRVPAPVFTSRYHIYGFEQNKRISSWNDLGPNPVAAIRGFETIKRYLPEDQVIWVNSPAQLLGLLALKRVQYVVGLENQMAAELKNAVSPSAKSIRRLNDKPLHEVVLYHYLAPAHAALIDRLAKAISEEVTRQPFDEEQIILPDPLTDD